MDHLSSCYFCSRALDEPLGTYTVSGTGGEVAVTLCSTCHRKLDLIFDTTETVTIEAQDDTRPEQSGGGAVDETADLVRDEEEPDIEDDDVAVEASTDDERDAATDDGEPASIDDSADEESDDRETPAAGTTDGSDADDPLELDAEEEPLTQDTDPASASEAVPFADERTDDAEDGFEGQMEPDEFGETDTGEGDGPDDEPDTVMPDDESSAEITDDEADVDSGIDPSILQADEIATGRVDIDEALDADRPADTESPADDQPAEGDTDESGVDDEGATADGPETGDGEFGTDDADPADDEQTDDDAGEEIDQIIGELDEEIEELGGGAEDSQQPAEESGEDAENGGFAFDQGSEAESSAEDITSEMEPDIPEEFDTGGTDETDDEEAADDSERIIFGADSMVRDDLVDEPDDDLTDGEPVDGGLAEQDEADQSVDPTGSDIADEADEFDDIGPRSGDETPNGNDQPDAAGADETHPSTDDKPSISALEYNKVMRLLQNREFPVDREEIVTVAANAYQLSEADCLAVIDLAIDRGLLAEDGDVLVRPD